MSGRTPSFIVVGLVIIMFLLGLFYMSCSSKSNELRMSLEQFEERIRSLTIKNSDAEKKIANINSRKHEIEEEKLTIQRQIEKKDSEINDLNTKLNERTAELQSLRSDKKALDEQLSEYKSMSESIASKNSLIEKLQQQINDQKQTNDNELTRLKQELESYKNQRLQNNQPPANEQQNPFVIPNQRFRPFIPNNLTTRSIASLFQDPIGKLNNISKEMKAQIVPAAFDVKDKVLNVLGIDTNSSNQQQDVHGNRADQNVPAPPLANNAQQRLQPDHIESAQGAPQRAGGLNEDRQPAAEEEADNAQFQHRLHRSLNETVSENKNIKHADDDEADDEEQLGMDNDQLNHVSSSISSSTSIDKHEIANDNHPIPAPAPIQSNNDNYRVADREQFRSNRDHDREQQQQLDNGEEIADDNNEHGHQVKKRHVV